MLRKTILTVCKRLDKPARRFDRFMRLAKKEARSPVPIALRDRFDMWRRGFLGESLIIYELDRNDPGAYVTDFERHVRTPDLNGRYRLVLQDKLLFARMLKNLGSQVVPAFGVIERGRMRFTGGAAQDAAEYLIELLREHPRLVLKPLAGGGGEEIRFLRADGPQIVLNEQPISGKDLEQLTRSMKGDLVTRQIEQRAEIAALYPRTVNTLRMLTMWDEDLGEPFVAAAVLRIGRRECYPVDNWTRGGLTADVDIETGRLGRAVSHPGPTGRLVWHSHHPETAAAIEGFVLPGWNEIRARMMEICRGVPFLIYVGWDLILTGDGFRILEGNHYPDLNLMQVHRPLLREPRIVRFYEAHGVVDRPFPVRRAATRATPARSRSRQPAPPTSPLDAG